MIRTFLITPLNVILTCIACVFEMTFHYRLCQDNFYEDCCKEPLRFLRILIREVVKSAGDIAARQHQTHFDRLCL